jgi:hypothetical protein
MTTFAIFDRPDSAAPTVVADRFSWFAALLPPVFALAHGLWLALLGYAIILAVLIAGRSWIGDGAAFWIYVVSAIWIGFEAPALRRAALRRRGWSDRGDIIAMSPDLAQLEWLKRRVAA